MSKPKTYWRERLRKIRKRAKELGGADSLLDLGPLCDMESQTFFGERKFIISNDPANPWFGWFYTENKKFVDLSGLKPYK